MWSWFGPSDLDKQAARLQKQLDVALAELAAVKKLVQSLSDESLARLRHLDRPKRVVLIKVYPVGESVMNDLLSYEVLLPVLVPPHDVVRREVTVTVDGVQQGPEAQGPSEHTVEVDGVTYDAFESFDVKQGASVTISAQDIDDAGNRSAPVVYEFKATDTIPPAAPGGLTVRATGEKFLDLTPVTPAEPAPAPEEPTPTEDTQPPAAG